MRKLTKSQSKELQKHGQTTIDDCPTYDQLIARGFEYIYCDQFEEAIKMFNNAIEIEPELLAYQGRALCETFLISRKPDVSLSQVVRIMSDLSEALNIAISFFEPLDTLTDGSNRD